MSYLGASGTLASDGSRDYTWDPSGQMTATQVPGNTGFSVMNDAHGDLTATFSPTATAAGLAGHATYAPYGIPTPTGYRPDIGFQADYTDPSTSLAMMGARWYNPGTGSFTAIDVIDGMPLPATVDGNPYAYTSGDPLTEADPTGHFNPGGWVKQGWRYLTRLPVLPEAITFDGPGWLLGGLGMGAEIASLTGSMLYATMGSASGGDCPAGPGTCYVPQDRSHGYYAETPGAGGSADLGESASGSSPDGGCSSFAACWRPLPPPPPRNCFAAGLCGAKAPSEGAAHSPTITHTVTTATGYKQACNATGYCYIVATTGNGNGAGGLTPVLTSGPTNGGTPPNWEQLLFPGFEDSTPRTAAGSSGSQGGAGQPPTTNGACEGPDEGPFDLSAPGALREAAVRVHNLATPAARFNESAVALAQVDLLDGSTQYYASASAGRLSLAQVRMLVRFGVPLENILTGARGHAEMNIINSMLPKGAKISRWGIAYGSKNNPNPCGKCEPFVKGDIEGAC
jgi:RHS repeat-associated protein